MAKGEVTQNTIHTVAFKLFVNQGYHGTSMRQIAQASDLTAASIYNHYKNKEEIFRKILMENHPYHQILPILETAQGDNAEELLTDVAQRVYKVIRNRKELLHLMFIELVEFEGKHFGEIFRSLSPRIFKFLARLRSTKRELRRISAGNIMLSLIGLIMSQWILESMFLRNIKLPGSGRHFEDALDIYLHGILVSGASH